jgi:tripartite-type tricarboxylate transporter receptor subunit TctC
MHKNNENPIPASVFRHFCLKVPANASVFIFGLVLAFTLSPAFSSQVIPHTAATPLTKQTPSESGTAQPKQKWPTRPIKYVVPFPPGGFADNMARSLSPVMAQSLNQSIMVENRAGGNAMIGYAAVADSPADGYTWLAVTLTHAINQSLFPNKWVKLSAGFTPVALLATSPLVVVVNPDVKATTLAELALLAKAGEKDKPISAGSSGNGTPPHLGLALLEDALGVDILHIPYKGGAPSILDLLSHQVDMIVANLPEALPHIRAGKLRALAVTGAKRSAFLPDVPTTAEAGYPSIVIENWTGLMLPANTPPAISAQILTEVSAAMATPDMKMRLDAMGFTPAIMSGEALQTFINNEVNRWGKVVRDKKIQPE